MEKVIVKIHSGKIFVMIPVREYKKIPNYFFIELDLSTIKSREKNEKRI